MPTDSFPLFGEMRWNSSELALALLLSPQRVSQLSKEHVLPPAVDGLYVPIESVASYIRYLRQREAGKSQAGEAVRKMQLENEMRQIKLQRIAGELVPVDRVQKDWFEVSRRVRDALLNLPSRLSGVFAAEANQEKIFESFTKEIHQVLTELSTRQPKVKSEPGLPFEKPLEEPRSPEDEVSQGEAEPPEDRFSTGD